MKNLESTLMAIHVILLFMSIVVFIIGIFIMSSSVLIVAISMVYGSWILFFSTMY